MINKFVDILFSKSPNYIRRLILILVDIFLISITYKIGLIIYNVSFNSKFYFCLLILSILIYILTGQYRSITRYLDNKSLILLSLRTFFVLLFLGFISEINDYSILIFLWIFISLSLIFIRLAFKDLFFYFKSFNYKYTKVAIYGAGEAGNQLLASLKLDRRFKVIYFFDDSEILQNRFINGIPIKDPKKIKSYINDFQQLLIAIPSLNSNKLRILLNELPYLKMPVLKIPSIEEISSGKTLVNELKPISLENILGRDPVKPNLNLIKKEIQNKIVCVTGAGGSIGSEICKQVIKFNPEALVIIDISEYALYTIQQEIININPEIKLYTILGNMVEISFMEDLFKRIKINIIFHAAAYKHVPLVEENPFQGIYNNVYSTLNLCNIAQKNNIDHLLLISSDKAVRPTNFMGASKRIAELIFQAYSSKSKKTKYCIVRFGNVLGSSGSVVPKFCKQIADGGPVTITHPEITRYFMTIKEATLLVIQSLCLSKGGDILLLDMGKQLKIRDLAIKMIKLSGLKIKDKDNINGDIEITYDGLRPGEKLYEELLIDAEAKKTIHPKIFVAREKSIDKEILLQKLKDLESAISKNDFNSLVNCVKVIVPEWFNKNI